MPMITLEYDDKIVSDEEAEDLSLATQKVVSKVTGIKDVFVYANSARIKVQISPIEIFVWMSANKIDNPDELIGKIKKELSNWKTSSQFKHPINLSLIPMNWKLEIAI